MPSVNDPAFNEEDTPDDLRSLKTTKKKGKKKGSKQKVVDEYKDSSSEEPKLSPELPPLLANVDPSPPPSRSLSSSPSPASGPEHQPEPEPEPASEAEPGLRTESDSQLPSPTLQAHGREPGYQYGNRLNGPYGQLTAARHGLSPQALSPAFIGVAVGEDRDASQSPTQLPLAFNVLQNVPSLSSSPQGGIPLPPSAPRLQTHSMSPPFQSALPSKERKASVNSHPARTVPFYTPPPPHMPQRHFTRRPDMDFTSPVQADVITAGSKGYYCGFDTLEMAGVGTSSVAVNVVLVGTPGGLDVYRLLRQRTDVVGRLEGLRGAVIDAKILPWSERYDPSSTKRPLVMCVLHGPADGATNDGIARDRIDQTTPDASSLQTTVEIYSLATSELICCLYKSPIVDAPPNPSLSSIGNLRIAAEGRFITVTAGASGEVFLFAAYVNPASDDALPFRCVAKFWTATNAQGVLPTDANAATREAPNTAETKIPVVALSPRWLAIRPPLLSSAQISAQGTPLLSPRNPDPPGVSAHVSPPPPSVTCEVDAPFSNTLFDRVAKQATQELRKGAQWVGEQGKQAWNAYWRRSSPTQSDAIHQNLQSPPQTDTTVFPPTHAQSNDPHPILVEPASVSIIDLKKMLDYEESPAKGALTPISTFCLPDGCSFMSFAPGGLALLATNQVGDASTIWDLSQITNGRSCAPFSSTSDFGSPYVSMAARFTRQTPSVVLEVAWSAHGQRLALLTLKGTIHLHEVPLPSSRSSLTHNGGALSPSFVGIPSPGSSPQGDASLPSFVNSVRARFQTFPGITLRAPANTNSIGNTVSSASAYARHTGRKAFKQGVNMATDTALKIRHHEETKIRLQPKQRTLRPGCLRWLNGRESGLIATVFDGQVKLHTVKSNHYVQGKRTALYLTASRRPVSESALHSIGGDGKRGEESPAACARAGPHGFWALNKNSTIRRASLGAIRGAEPVVPDKDTSPVYLPFHRVSHVNLYSFDSPTLRKGNKATKAPTSPGFGSDDWVFGLPLAPTTKITCQTGETEDDADHDLAHGNMQDLLGDSHRPTQSEVDSLSF
ncbi:hypothetical protein AAFC00_001815 [Neodothiora populina]|uniref:Uncharacterized protein n=1 Tax=Neodothiora populina TaxID=2781224 RepID=A0ABR3PQ77_9PEZI